MRNAGLCVALTFASACGGSAVSAEPSTDDEVLVAPIGQLRWKSDVDRQQAFCTGTLVAPDLVLSSRHCMYDERGRYRADTGKWSFSLAASAVKLVASGSTEIREISLPVLVMTNDSASSPPFGTPDLSLLRLATPITSVAPLGIAQAEIALTDSGFVSIGYGTGKRSSAPMRVGALEGLAPRYEVAAVPSAADASSCPGDSGSPLLRADAGGALLVYGVKQRPASFEPASRLCAFGAVYGLFQNQASHDFLESFGLLEQTAPADPN